MKIINNSIKLFLICAITYSTTFAQDYIRPPMINVPSGSFMMGSNIGKDDSKPMHHVSVAAFQMAKYPVTVAEFRIFVKETNYKSTTVKCPDLIDQNWYSDPGKKSNGNWEKHLQSYSDFQPVTCITYQDVIAYINWLNKKSGLTYRLPTEEEWEYATKANTTTSYFWGNDITKAYLYGNFADQSSEYFVSKEYGASYNGFIRTTNENDGEPFGAIVGLYHPNPFGLYDMVGNVDQMLSTCYSVDTYKNKLSKVKETDKCKYITVRGGSWHYKPNPLWYRSRTKKASTFSSTRRGFRLAVDGHGNNIDESSKTFEESLKKAKHIHLATRPTIPNIPKNIQLVKLKDSIYKISWDQNNSSEITGYEIYQSNNSNAHILGGFYQKYYDKIKTISATNNTSEVTVSKKGNSFKIVAKKMEFTSLPSKPVVVLNELKTVNIPGNIALENSFSLTNLTLRHRKATDKRSELYYLTILGEAFKQNFATAKFNVNVEKTGWYKLNYSGGPRSRKTGTFFMLTKGNKVIGEIKYDSKINDRTSDRHKVYLEKGNYNLKINFLLNLKSMDMWNLFKLNFTEVTTK